MTNDYRPIGCDQHSVLELLAIRQTPVEVRAVAADGTPAAYAGRVSDLLTRDRAEYLVVLDGEGREHAIRLDRVAVIFDRDGNALWRRESDV
jgi:transcriptional antiterminator Rof (Rho-off)